MNSKLLIYIPTYNRSSQLIRQLTSLKSQLRSHIRRVRILVSVNDFDNDVYSDIFDKFSNSVIKFRINPGNIGGNANITLGFTFAKSDEYLWILSDDDFINKYALDEIFKAIDSGRDLIHIGDYSKKTSIKLNIDNIFTAPKGAGFGLISVVIFKISSIKNFIQAGFDYLESSFPHLAIIMSFVKHNKRNVNVTCISHSKVFSSDESCTQDTGDYSISRLGFGYLSDFLPRNKKNHFLWSWIRNNWFGMIVAKSHYPLRYKKMIGFLFLSNPLLLIFLFFMRLYVPLKKVFIHLWERIL